MGIICRIGNSFFPGQLVRLKQQIITKGLGGLDAANLLAIKDRIKESHFEVNALTIGMKLELEALQFYRSWARKVDSEEAKAFFLELAQWEEDHYLAFERELDMLKEDYFTMNNFVPM